MKRGEVWWVDFEPAMGSEIRKTRPAVIVSNDASNGAMSRVQVIPVTSNTSKLYVFESRIEVKGAQGKAMADQIMTADKQRLKKRIGRVSPSEMLGIERAIKVQLGIH
ncbi:MAG: type II toxin-antitoxin system PemK/MazF family toxin [Betaproteobacteria bacterium]|nr:type II toxin-antitoxin system PemK/MazF family toxin [Betaproteobacteria bacterium]